MTADYDVQVSRTTVRGQGPEVVLAFGSPGKRADAAVAFSNPQDVRRLAAELAAAAEWLEMMRG